MYLHLKVIFVVLSDVAKVLAKYIQKMNDDILGTESSVGNCLQRSEIKDIHIFI